MDSTNISILSKGKVSASTSGVEAYSKEVLNDEICRLIAINVQLMTDKMEIEKVKVNLKVNKIQLFEKKNSLVVKKEKFRAEIVILNAAGFSNVLICRY